MLQFAVWNCVNTEVGPGHTTFLANIAGVKDIQIGLAGIPFFSELYELVSVTFEGTAYRAGMTVFPSYHPDGEPQFGLIKSILVLNQTSHTPTIKLVVQKWETIWFDRPFFVYSVIPTHVLAAVDVRELLDHHPLHAVKSFSEHDGIEENRIVFIVIVQESTMKLRDDDMLTVYTLHCAIDFFRKSAY